jgi:hypothetical protein
MPKPPFPWSQGCGNRDNGQGGAVTAAQRISLCPTSTWAWFLYPYEIITLFVHRATLSGQRAATDCLLNVTPAAPSPRQKIQAPLYNGHSSGNIFTRPLS